MSNLSVRGCCLVISVLFVAPPSLHARQVDEDRDRQLRDRFAAILERAPRRGTALDRVYGYHAERGTLDSLVEAERERAKTNPNDGAPWLLIGLIESQRGRDGAAVDAFRIAEQKRPDDALPSYYLGQSLVLIGKPDEAADAFERALTRKPSRADSLEIYQALGRVHQRARRNEKALAVWSRMEAAFPGDAKVKELIASALAEEGQFEPALARYEALATTAREPYRKVRFRTEAADLKLRLGRPADALRDFEGLLAGLEPESWLARDVRRRIDDVFLRNDDQAGLTKYYEAWIARSPDDIEAIARLGRTLAAQGRSADARSWLDRALKRAPSRKDLRLSLVELLVNEHKYGEAAEQYEAMSRNDPGNPDILREWGLVLLKDPSRPEAERRAGAARVWQKLLDGKPNDPSSAVQVADLSRRAGLADEAIALYEKAIALAPDAPQYREYLGEYYHFLHRDAEALATWRALAAGKNRDAKNLARLGEILSGFGFKTEAAGAFADAIALDPRSFELRIKLADLKIEAGDHDAAETQLSAAEGLADDEAQRNDALARRIANDRAAGRLSARVEALKKDVAGPEIRDAATWRRLALYAEAARQPVEAISAIEDAIRLDGASVASWSTAARLFETNGRLADASAAFRKLAGIDRRGRAEALGGVARLEARLGRKDEALRAGRESLAAAPDNPDQVRVFAELCSQIGAVDEGLEALRRVARANESDPGLLRDLGDALAREFRTDEAIEVDWRAFDRAKDIDTKLALVSRLADLYLRRNQIDLLIARLERIRGEDGRNREGTLCLARAYAASGDLGASRQQLESLLAADPRDVGLLQQLSELAEAENDLADAVRYQKQLLDIAPGGRSAFRLTQLALRAGDIDAAEAVWSRSAESQNDLAQALPALDGLLVAGKPETVLAATGRLLGKHPGNWEILFREANALSALDRPADAARRFREILALRRNDDEEGEVSRSQRRAPPPAIARPGSSTMSGMPARNNILYRIRSVASVRRWSGLEGGVPFASTFRINPTDFGEARMAALAGLAMLARREENEAKWLDEWRKGEGGRSTDPRFLWDRFYVALVLGEYREAYEAARDLVRASGRDPSADYALIYATTSRNAPSGATVARAAASARIAALHPLPPAEVDLIRDAFRSVAVAKPIWLNATVLEIPLAELKRAGRLDGPDEFYREQVASAATLFSIQVASTMAAELGDVAALQALSAAFDRSPENARWSVSAGQPYMVLTNDGTVVIPAYHLARVMLARANEKNHADVLKILDDHLDSRRIADPAARRARASNSTQVDVTRITYPIFSSQTASRLYSLDFPAPSPYLDGGSILLLRNAFALFQRDGILANLIDDSRKRADAKPGDPSARLALSALLWWSEDKSGALRELERAIALAPGDAELKLTLAELRSQRKEFDEALAAVDAIETVDQDLTRRRELLALRLAVETKRPERARQAAERLFGLRLEAPTLLTLAGQMHQLGLHDLADAVLARVRRRAGNDTDSLAGLMAQYRRQGNPDAAVQVAMQILRRSSGMTSAVVEVEDPPQRAAIQVLASSGKLREMTERLEAQLKLSPQSIPIRRTLATYYRAGNQTEKLKALNDSMVALRPDDSRLRMDVIFQLARAGDTAAALGQYKAALRKQPTLLSSTIRTLLPILQSQGKAVEFVDAIEDVGLKSFEEISAAIFDACRTLLNDPKTTDRGLALLRKAWDAYPNGRSLMITALPLYPTIWERPEGYDYAREAVIPGPNSAPVDPWAGMTVAPRTLPGSRAPAATISSRLLDAAEGRKAFDPLAAEIEAAIGRQPGWLTGKALLGLIRVRQGRIDEGKRLLEPVLESRPPDAALQCIGFALNDDPAFDSVALPIFEKAFQGEFPWGQFGADFRDSPAGRLARIYLRAGRVEDARDIALKAVERRRSGMAPTPLGAYYKVAALGSIGPFLLESGDPASALRVDIEFLSLTDDIESARKYPNAQESVDLYVSRTRDRVDRLLGHLDKASAASILGRPAPIDLVMAVYPREADKTAVRSLFVTALDAVAGDADLLGRVRAAAKVHPGEIESATAEALASCVGAKPAEIAQAATRLEKIAREAPRDAIAAPARPDPRQRAEAARRLGLWLVARACWADPTTSEAGDRLASIALEAAGRQADDSWAMAMLREWGRVALDRGDRVAAEARWAAVLDLILARPGTSGAARTPALTIDRFRQASRLARLAAESGLDALSIRAMVESLRGGPPVPAIPATPPVRVAAGLTTGDDAADDPASTLVEESVDELHTLWRRHDVAPNRIYEALREIVLPEARPKEIFCYNVAIERTLRTDPNDAAGSNSPPAWTLGRLLCRAAVDSGRVADLRARIAERQAQPAARRPAQWLLAILATQKEGR